ncbi:type II secretion system secretin GspD [Thalassomonas sp. M1454]|uniref:type II secretion system secretin GspD n=1 Tax=Thalassomonas sp. M1454 TaxID=2594477 RepID=UPI00117CA5FF|nr:type II secretion system secretin GspD [Thalassomonas sp. M1454]TRX57901.1 type II secretion system protein GspD [Thalassomonas sp. M1454]
MRLLLSAKHIKRVAINLVATISIGCTLAIASVSAAQYSPNFKGTEITEFINIVGKSLKKTIIIDPKVRGKINVRSYDLLTEEQYYQFFLNVLEVYGFSVVEMDNNVFKVVPNKNAKTSAIPVVGDENPGVGDEMVTRVLEVKNVSVRELSPLLRQLSDQAGGGNVVHYEPSNVIMLTGTAAVVNRLVNIIQRVDKAGDQDVQIVNLKYASASEIVRIIENINKPKSGKSDTPAFLIPKIVADDRTNSVIISGEAQARERITKLINRLDSELESVGNTRVYYLKYSKAEDLVSVLQSVSDSMQASATTSKTSSSKTTTASRRGSNRNVSIDSHADTNTIVITAEPDMLRSLESVIRQLDVRRAQVLVEAIIVEVFESEGAQLGVQWFHEEGGFTQFNNGIVPISGVAAGAIAAEGEEGNTVTTIDGNGNPVTTTNPDVDGDYSILAQLLGNVNGMMFGVVEDGWGAIVQAVSTDTNSNILATPSITTLDNEEAYFIVGQEVPIITGSATGSNNANPFQTVERKEVGIKLKVTPQVNEGSGVQLTIEQEVSSVSGTTGVDIAINKREIKTTVMADHGDTIILGGLIDEDVQESQQKVPILGDIPFIGALFRSTGNTTRKRNLMVFIKPTIIREGDILNSISKEKYNFMRADELRKQEEGLALMDDAVLPLLPEWKDDLELPPTFDEYMEERAIEELGKDPENNTLEQDGNEQ